MIHRTAIIDPKAEIESGVEIGPYVVIEGGVKIGRGTQVGPHVHIQGLTEIGPDNFIGTGACIGLPPQHLDYKGAPTKLIIGAGNTIRESVSIHRAYHEGDATVVGDGCFFMAASHIAHDCRIGNRVIIANNALLAGHVSIDDRAFISGGVVIHQFCRVGRLAMVSGLSGVGQDTPPFLIVEGRPAVIRAINSVGLQRAGFSEETRRALKQLFRRLYRAGRMARAVIAEIENEKLSFEERELVDFYKGTKRGVIPYGGSRGRGASD